MGKKVWLRNVREGTTSVVAVRAELRREDTTQSCRKSRIVTGGHDFSRAESPRNTPGFGRREKAGTKVVYAYLPDPV